MISQYSGDVINSTCVKKSSVLYNGRKFVFSKESKTVSFKESWTGLENDEKGKG